jgi:polyhydroxyalkanoate synthesis regulator phasin|tara:strand:+ start:426 stop:599 length:174 start_codon:yes stop_codon:yes gene_type:complete
MADVKTTTEEFAASGSLAKVQEIIESTESEYPLQESIKFLSTKIDELVEEVNKLKNE